MILRHNRRVHLGRIGKNKFGREEFRGPVCAFLELVPNGLRHSFHRQRELASRLHLEEERRKKKLVSKRTACD